VRHEFHHIEEAAVRKEADVVHRNDAGMLEAGQHACFGAESLGLCRIDEHTRDLDGNRSLQFAVRRAKHNTHSALANRLVQLVAVGQFGKRGHFPQARQRAIRQPGHEGSNPRISRASARYSASLPLVARISARTSSRKRRRAACR
jgi:hypothetical protein